MLQRLLLILMAVALLSACAVPIKEEDFYTDKGPDGAVETHFFSTDITDIGKEAWDSMREGMTCMSGGAIADIKGEIEKLCTKTKCSEETAKAVKQAVRALRLTVARIQFARALSLRAQ
jgi:PBP1b-binding outer membrane lipoprotein LpoB